MKSHYQVLIIGGGTGGIMTAAQFRRKRPTASIAIVEPNEDHWYQPAWTLVGAGTFDFEATRRKESTVIPAGVDWIKDKATVFLPEENKIHTEKSGEISYDYLIVSAGIKMDIDALPGLREALQTDFVCSNYLDPRKTYRLLKNFKGGNAIFTQPTTPIRCGGAPQKIMYMAEEYLRKHGLREKTNVLFATPGSVIFGVKEFADTLNSIIRSRKIIFKPFYAPVRIDPVKREIIFKYVNPNAAIDPNSLNGNLGESLNDQGEVVMKYDLLHLAPPQAAPDFIQSSPFAYQDGPNKGWMEVDIHTLQHPRYRNVFGVGDAAALPTAKTGAAIRKQAPVVVGNIIHLMEHKQEAMQQYSGYSSCPIVTGYGKMLLCEFKYDNVRDSDPFLKKFVDTTKEQWSMWILKKYGLPWLYWNMMLKGRM